MAMEAIKVAPIIHVSIIRRVVRQKDLAFDVKCRGMETQETHSHVGDACQWSSEDWTYSGQK